MRISSWALLKNFGLFAVACALSACHLADPKERGADAGKNSGANFAVESASGKVSATENHGVFSLPVRRVYSFAVCVKSLDRSQPLINQTFRIDEVQKEVRTDNRGCMNWSEKINFNYLADSIYVPLNRTLTATGLTRGSQTVRLAINPWSHGESPADAVDLDHASIAPLLEDAKLSTARLAGMDTQTQSVQNRSVWVEDGRLLVTDDRLTAQGLSLNYQLSVTPQLLLTRINGDRYVEPLNRGRFRVTFSIVHQDVVNGAEVRRVLGYTQQDGLEMTNNVLPIKAPFVFSHLPKSGQLLLALRLEPLSGPQGLTTFEGLYPLGDYRQIKSGAFLKISPQVVSAGIFELQTYVTDTKNLPPAPTIPVAKANTASPGSAPANGPANSGVPTAGPANSPTAPATASPPSAPEELTTMPGNTGAPSPAVTSPPQTQAARIEVDHLRFTVVQRGQESTTRKKLIYNVRACLKNGIDQDALIARKFKVTKFRSETVSTAVTEDLTTDNTSCLYWNDSIEFNNYDCQHYLKGFVQIANTDLGMNERIEYVINPWSSGNFAMDLRDVSNPRELTLDCAKVDKPAPPSEIDLDTFSYSTPPEEGVRYQVDAGLNLKIHRKIWLRIDPKVISYSNLDQGIEDRKALRDGPYLLRLAVVRHRGFDSNNTYVTSNDVLVNQIGGRITTDVEFSTYDHKALGNRNVLLMELFPVRPEMVRVDEQGRLQPRAETKDLGTLIKKDSGLVSPTFAGQITLNQKDASGALKRFGSSALAQYLVHGTASPAADPQSAIAGIVRDGKKLRRQQISEASQILDPAVYAERNNLVFLNMSAPRGHENLLRAMGVDSKTYTRLSQMMALRINAWNAFFAKAAPVQPQIFNELVTQGRLSTDLAQRLCLGFVYEIMGEKRIERTLQHSLVSDCVSSAKDPSQFFYVEKRLLIRKLNGSEFVRGLNRSLSIMTAFTLTSDFSKTFAIDRTLSASGGVSFSPLKFVNLGVSGTIGATWSDHETQSNSNMVMISEATNLNVTESQIRLKIDAFEECAVVRLNPVLFQKKKHRWFWQSSEEYANYFNADFTPTQQAEAAHRGLLVCSGQTKNQGLEKIERYYFISPVQPAGEVHDDRDERNRSFFMALRGLNDYNRFLHLIKDNASIPKGAKAEDVNYSDLGVFLQQLFITSPTAPGHFHDMTP